MCVDAMVGLQHVQIQEEHGHHLHFHYRPVLELYGSLVTLQMDVTRNVNNCFPCYGQKNVGFRIKHCTYSNTKMFFLVYLCDITVWHAEEFHSSGQ